MYEWVWRHLPFGLPGKITGSVLLVAATVALLWFWIFPAVEPLLPFDDVQVTGDQPVLEPPGGADPGVDPGLSPGVSPGPGTGPTATPTTGAR